MKEKMLKEIKLKLLQKRRELIGEVKNSDEASQAYREESTPDILDQASTSYSKEFLMSLGDSDRRLLKEVDSALGKIESGNYGECEKCGEMISDKRLLSVPFTRYCINCQAEIERKSS